MNFDTRMLETALFDGITNSYTDPNKILHYKLAYRQALETIEGDRALLIDLMDRLEAMNLEDTDQAKRIIEEEGKRIVAHLYETDNHLLLQDHGGAPLSIEFLESILPSSGIVFANLVDLEIKTYRELDGK